MECISHLSRPLCADYGECQDTREEINKASYCGEHAVCTNTIGSFTCTCDPGFESFVGDVGCSDINECGQSSTVSHCGPNTRCDNTVGSYHCGEDTCHDGYFNWRSSDGKHRLIFIHTRGRVSTPQHRLVFIDTRGREGRIKHRQPLGK